MPTTSTVLDAPSTTTRADQLHAELDSLGITWDQLTASVNEDGTNVGDLPITVSDRALLVWFEYASDGDALTA